MNVVLFTVLPDLVYNFFNHSILSRSLSQGIWSLKVVDIKQYGTGKICKRVDDYSYGGGGMLMRPDILGNCIEDNIDISCLNQKGKLFIYTSPRGLILNQGFAQKSATDVTDLYILCGRFEGIDQRIVEYYNIKEVSLGDFILFGGEVASFAILESIIRLLPGTISKSTLQEESFSGELHNMLEYDQFTKPQKWKGKEIPHVLLSGNHSEIKKWRLKNAQYKTLQRNEKTTYPLLLTTNKTNNI
ncbi:MAG: tRNA (guanosine(37)-N1)-methyltransferase TrmD [Alphaproteobacteria bacterium]|nr:tRNA (guanosine(37)-N1)-methyltransferase TrmD [Rickettsiales bacterium]